ncbi:MAG TPA: acyl-CoA dehydrogenase family protein [Acidimicrobiales bacterium]|nr:acyl-CoA dehydrogenase family protein [Acidimicrobiales bacterium]
MSRGAEEETGMGGPYDEAAAWFREHWDPDMPLREWWRLLAESGWGFPTWPVGTYGRGLSTDAARAVADARRDTGVAPPPAGIAQNLAGPTIIAHGTDEQKSRFLPGIVAGEVWCQLFSEPGAGSDLASLQTRAQRDGDEWVVNGQKVWTSGAHIARYGILVARTDPTVPKHRGLSYFVIAMDQPGIEVRPIREMTGRAIFNEVFMTDARVPGENQIGGLGEGWSVALTTLANERTMLGAGSFGSSGSGLDIRALDPDAPAGSLVRGGPPPEGRRHGGAADLLTAVVERYGRGDDPVARQEVARIHSLIEIARYTDLRAKAAIEAGGRPGPEVSVGKLAASHLLRTMRDTLFRLCGPDATLWGEDAPWGGRVHEVGLSSYLISIGGGTDQIQRNIIGERVLGLPREPRADKDVPFNELKVGTQAGAR